MKMFALFVAMVATLCAVPAFANGNGPPPCHPVFGCNDDGGDNTNTNNASAEADATAVAGSLSAAGVFDSGNSSSTAITGPATSFSDQDQHQGQGQGQQQGINFSDDDTVVYEEAASSAASLYLGSCQAGVSAQTHMGGGSLGSPDSVCLLFTASQVAASLNDYELAHKLLGEAVEILKIRTNPVRRFFQGIPLLGRVF